MLAFWRRSAEHHVTATSALLECVQRVESDLLEVRQELSAERPLRIAAAAQAAPAIGAAIEEWARSMRAPMPRGRSGGLARAANAWRYLDGTFMPESEKEAAYLEEYERFARGGRARAKTAQRAADGTFLPDEIEQ